MKDLSSSAKSKSSSFRYSFRSHEMIFSMQPSDNIYSLIFFISVSRDVVSHVTELLTSLYQIILYLFSFFSIFKINMFNNIRDGRRNRTHFLRFTYSYSVCPNCCCEIFSNDLWSSAICYLGVGFIAYHHLKGFDNIFVLSLESLQSKHYIIQYYLSLPLRHRT